MTHAMVLTPVPEPDPSRRTVVIDWKCLLCGWHEDEEVPDDVVADGLSRARKAQRRHVLAEHPEHAGDVA